MSRIKIGKAVQSSPTGLTLAYSTGGQRATLGSVFDGDALKQKLGLADKPAATVPVGQKAAASSTTKIDLVGDAYRLREQELAAQKAREVEAAWKEHEALDQTAREIAQYEKSQPLVKNDVPEVVRSTASTAAKPDAEAIVAGRTIQPTKTMQEFIDAREGIGTATKSARESAGAFVKADVEKQLAQKPAVGVQQFIDAREGIGQGVKSAEESAKVFAENGFGPVTASKAEQIVAAQTVQPSMGVQEFINAREGIGSVPKSASESLEVFSQAGKTAETAVEDVAKNKSLWDKFKDFGKGLGSKLKGFGSKAVNWFKGLPKAGKIGCIVAAVAAVAAGIYGLCKLFGGDKKEDTPIVAPTDYSPQAPVTDDTPAAPVEPEQPEQPEEPETPSQPVPVVPTEPEQDDDIREIKDDVKEVKDDVKEIKNKIDQLVIPVPVAPTEPEQDDEIKNDIKEIKDDVKEVKDDVKEIKDKLNQPAVLVEPEQPEEPVAPVEPTEPEQPEQPEEPEEPVAPVEPTEPEQPATPAEDENIYTVVKGDCVWNIAKDHLIKLHEGEAGYTPTDAEIQKHTNELMDYNPQLHWESDHYHVLIRPGDKISLVKKENK